MPWVAAIAQGAGQIGEGIGGYVQSNEQLAAMKKAQAAEQEFINQQNAIRRQDAYAAGQQVQDAARMAQGYTEDFANYGANKSYEGLGQAVDSMTAGSNAAQGSIGAGYDSAIGAMGDAAGNISNAGHLGRNALGSYYNEARSDLGQVAGLQRFIDPASQGYGASNVMGAQDRLGGLLDQQGGMYGGFEQDPGYQFRQQQGEQAIMRAGSAQGGRMGGDKLKALAEFNQNLASQEYGNFANRRQAEVGALSGSDAQRAGLLMNQAGRRDAALSQQQQAQMALAQAGIGAQTGIAGMDERQGQGIAGMYGAEGSQLSGINQGIAGLYGQRGEAIGGLQNQLGMATGGLQYSHGQGLQDLYAGVGRQLGGLEMQGAQAAGSYMTGIPTGGSPNFYGGVNYAGAGAGMAGAAAGQAGSDLAQLWMQGQGGGE